MGEEAGSSAEVAANILGVFEETKSSWVVSASIRVFK